MPALKDPNAKVRYLILLLMMFWRSAGERVGQRPVFEAD